jgi:hypothetical protein
VVFVFLCFDAVLFFKWNCLRILGFCNHFTNRSMDTI